MPSLDELRAWFRALDVHQRVCRTMVKSEIAMGICGREAVGIDRLGGARALVCEAHIPAKPEWFVRLKEGR